MAIINGTSGDDTLAGTGAGTVDTINGGAGKDLITSVNAPLDDTAAWDADAAAPGAGDILNGDAGDDVIIGSAGALISGGSGNDLLDGLPGTRLSGGADNDTIGGDIAVYSGLLANYAVTPTLTYIGQGLWAPVFEVKDLRPGSPDGQDIVYSNSITFADGTYTPPPAPDTDALFLSSSHEEFYLPETPADSAVPGTPTPVLDANNLLAFGVTATSFAIAGGADAAAFNIDPLTGQLSFVTPPDFEAPTDVDSITRSLSLAPSVAGDNIYEVVLRVVDAGGVTDLVGVLVHVDDVAVDFAAGADGEVLTGTLENDNFDDGGFLNVSFSGLAGDDTFTTNSPARVDGGSGFDTVELLRAETSNLRLVEVGTTTTVSDGSVLNNIEAVAFTGSVTSDIIDANGVLTLALELNGNEGDDLLMSGGAGDVLIGGAGSDLLVGNVGNDALYASLVPDSGVPNTPVPGEADLLIGGAGDDLIVGDGGNTTVLFSGNRANYTLVRDALTGVVTVIDNVGSDGVDTVSDFAVLRFRDAQLDANLNPAVPVNAAPIIVANGGGTAGAYTIAENTVGVAVPAAFDPNGDTLTYSLAGGADAAKFAINASNGALSFLVAPNAEAPTDAGANGVYDVVVRVSDGTLSDTQALAIAVTDVNEFAVGVPTDGNTSPIVWTGSTSTIADPSGLLAANLQGGTSGQYGQLLGLGTRGGAMTLSANVRFDSTGSWERVVDFGQAFSTGIGNIYVGRLGGTNDLTFTIEKNGVYTYRANAVGAITNGQWMNFTASVDAAGLMKLYVNGTLAATTQGVVPETGLRDFFYVGKSGWAPDTGLDGAVDKLVVLQGSVTPAQAQSLYVNGYAGTTGLPVGTAYDVGATVEAGRHAVSSGAAAGTPVNLTVKAVDADATNNSVSYAITTAGSPFVIDAATGVVTVAPGAVLNAATAASHTIAVKATSADGSASTQNFTIYVDPAASSAPLIDSNGGGATAALTVNENTTAVTTVHATDPNATAVTYSIVGGADYAKFSINTTTGALRFVSAPNAEARTDVGANGVYDVIVQATDGLLVDKQALAVTVADVNEFAVTMPVDGNAAANTVASGATGGTAVGITARSTDADAGNNTVSYAITTAGSPFAIDPVTGVVTVAAGTTLNYAFATTYTITVRASSSDGSVATQNFTISGNAPGNLAPVIDSNGGGATAALTINENGNWVTGVHATDPNGSAIQYSIVGGADAAMFKIDAGGGLSFKVAPNAEAVTDVGANGVYDVVVQASDGTLTDTQAIAVTVADVNEFAVIAPVDSDAAVNRVAQGAAVGTPVGVTARSTDADATRNTVSYAISGFTATSTYKIDAVTGVVSVNNPAGINYLTAKSHVITVVATSADGSVALSNFTIAVDKPPNAAPVIDSNGGGATAALTLNENTLFVTNVHATDPNADVVSYSIVGGADAALFQLFGASLNFKAAPNAEAPTDAGASGVYDVIVQASDGTLTDTQALAITVADVNEFIVSAPLDIDAAADAVAENLPAGTRVGITAKATDADRTNNTVSYALTVNPNGLFAIDPVTGVVTTTASLNHEACSLYGIQVRSASSDGSVCYWSYLISVGNVNEAPAISAPGGGTSASVTLASGIQAVTTVVASDPDAGQALTFSISGGADAASFAINSSTGALSFVATAGNYVALPLDAGGNNVYDVQVKVTDPAGAFDTQDIAVQLAQAPGQTLVGSSALVNSLVGGSGNDTMSGVGTYNYLFALDGNDTFGSSPGQDWLDGGSGNDTATYASAPAAVAADLSTGRGTAGNANGDYFFNVENLIGSAFNDTLVGSIFANLLMGGAGNDLLRGNGGGDTLAGDAGNDTFDFNAVGDSSPSQMTRIADFAAGDRIDVSGIDASIFGIGDQAFSYIGGGAFTGVAGQLRQAVVGSHTYVYADTNGDKVADFALDLIGVYNLVATDFVL